ncbi:MAG: ABC transporter ATP-binding protein [Eubacteriales bacterium]
MGFTLNEGDWLMIVHIATARARARLSTLFAERALYRRRLQVLGKDVRRYRAHELAKLVGVLAQTHTMGYGFTVGSVVRLGRYAYAPGSFSAGHAEDESAVAEALALTGLTEIADQNVPNPLRRRSTSDVSCAAFAQNPRCCCWMSRPITLITVYQSRCLS